MDSSIPAPDNAYMKEAGGDVPADYQDGSAVAGLPLVRRQMIKATHAESRSNEWQNCDGELGRLVHQLRWRRRASRLRRTALLTVLAIVTIGGNYVYSDVATVLSVKATGSPCDHYNQELRAFYCEKSLSELDQAFWVHLSEVPLIARGNFAFFGRYCPASTRSFGTAS